MAKKKVIELIENKVYLVKWQDAATPNENGWLDNDYDIDLIDMKTVGFLHNADDNKIVLKQNFYETGMCNLIVIPRAWIQSIKEMK